MSDMKITKEFATKIANAQIKKDNVVDPEECKKILEDSYSKAIKLFENAAGKKLEDCETKELNISKFTKKQLKAIEQEF